MDIKLYQLEGEGFSWTSVSTLPKLKEDGLCSKKVYSGAIFRLYSIWILALWLCDVLGVKEA